LPVTKRSEVMLLFLLFRARDQHNGSEVKGLA
jgi:hypothetical protein